MSSIIMCTISGCKCDFFDFSKIILLLSVTCFSSLLTITVCDFALSLRSINIFVKTLGEFACACVLCSCTLSTVNFCAVIGVILSEDLIIDNILLYVSSLCCC